MTSAPIPGPILLLAVIWFIYYLLSPKAQDEVRRHTESGGGIRWFGSRKNHRREMETKKRKKEKYFWDD